MLKRKSFAKLGGLQRTKKMSLPCCLLGCFQDEESFDEVFQKANFKTHIFKNRVKLETYNVSSCH